MATIARVTASSRGPGTMPSSIARRSCTSESKAPSVPRSRSVVMPARRVAAAAATARAMRSASGSFRTWSSQRVSLYGCRKRWECPSINPGIRVEPLSSTRVRAASRDTVDRSHRFDLRPANEDNHAAVRRVGDPVPNRVGDEEDGLCELSAGVLCWATRVGGNASVQAIRARGSDIGVGEGWG